MAQLTSLRAACAGLLSAALATAGMAAAGLATAAPAHAAPTTELISSGSTEWRYLDDGTDPADGLTERTGWTAADFDDSAWPIAAGSFGALHGELQPLSGGHTPDNLLTQHKHGSTENHEAFFFRTTVDVTAADLDSQKRLTGSILYDDAAAVYVNGEKIAGFDDAGISYPSEGEGRNLVYGGSNASAPKTGTIDVAADVLTAGENTIAVQLQQGRATSSDIYLDVADLTLSAPEEKPVHHSLLLGIGADPSERYISWFTSSGVDESVQIAAGAHTEMPADAQTVAPVTRGTSAVAGEEYVHATVTGLKPGTYSYRVGSEAGGWTDIEQFRVYENTLEHQFTFMGDAQIGASGNVEKDAAGWQATLDAANTMYPDAQFMYSAGDQVQTYAGDAGEYRGYLVPEQMRTQASAQTLGNHDYNRTKIQELYGQHFHQPNMWDGDPSKGTYWFKYNGVLHLNISTEDRGRYDDYRAYLEQIIAEQSHDTHWTVLTFHRSIYSSGTTHSQSLTTKGLRDGIAPIVKDLDIDLVLAGHDHSYTRTHLMDGTEPVLPEGDGAGAEGAGYAATPDTNPDDGHDVVYPKDGQVIYITANSSSGSKYYDLVPDAMVPWKHLNNQNYTPQFTNVDVKECSITSTTMTHTGDQVDKVELVKDGEAPTITHPGDTTVRLGADFDPMAGVEVSDACSDVTAGDITVTGDVDTSAPGDYELTYTVTDSSGNEATATRTITVAAGDDPTEKPTDDPTGPSDDPSDPSEDPTDPSEDPTDSVRELTVTPETITAADFVTDGAVEIVARGCTPGSTATVTVEPEGSGVAAFTDTATADETGAAAFTVYGENAEAPEAYIGSYDVTVRCAGGDDLTGRFSVVAEDDGDDEGSDDGRDDDGRDDDGQGGGDRDDDGTREDRNRDSDGRELPRTGSDITWALAAGGGLVALGAGVFVLARRRTNLT